MEDETVLSLIRQQAVNAKYVFSVCTGALICGAAGLLKGVRATTHWSAFHLRDTRAIQQSCACYGDSDKENADYGTQRVLVWQALDRNAVVGRCTCVRRCYGGGLVESAGEEEETYSREDEK